MNYFQRSGLLLILGMVLLITGVSAVTMGISPHHVNQGEMVTITVHGLQDGANVTMNWEVFLDEVPGSQFHWEILGLTFPINLDEADFRITNQNTVQNNVTLTNDVPGYGTRTLVMSGQSVNGIWSAGHENDFINGTWPIILNEGTVLPGKTSVLSLIEWHGTKMANPRIPSQVNGGPSDFVIPLSFSGVSGGTIRVSIIVDGDLVLSDMVTIGRPMSRTGNIYAASTPSGAELFIDGIYYGTTPRIVRNVPPGLRTVKISLPGYRDFEQRVTVPSLGFVSLTGIRLVREGPATGSLRVYSFPKWADVYLDTILVGTTPLTLPAVPVGPHQVTVKKAGYHDFTTTVTVRESMMPSQVIAILQRSMAAVGTGELVSGGPSVQASGSYATFEKPDWQPFTPTSREAMMQTVIDRRAERLQAFQ
ncbi:MAG TPA: PEGA domain-containing protein [Methanoregulaceae archaeon]|nr:PEGA domain-containing protein [Methanoregulaceae archaeon]